MLQHNPSLRLRHALLATFMLGVALACPPAFADTQQAKLVVSSNQYGVIQSISLQLDKSMIVDLPADVSDVVVSQPSVAGAVMRTSRRAIVQGIGGGDTNIIFLDSNGRTISVLDLKVIKERSQVGNALQDALARVIPGSNIKVESVTLEGEVNRVVLSGTVLSGEDKQNAQEVAIQFAGDPKNVANILQVTGVQQVALQVTVSEIRRETAKQLGIKLGGSLSIGTASFGLNSTIANSINTANQLTANFPGANLSVNAAISALEQRNALRILAQPTLTAISGEPAEFKAGGQFPLTSLDSNGQPTTIFKDYGVTLNFTPTVKANGNIALSIDTGVSELQGSQGAITQRNTKTSVEIRAGNTLAIGGLLQTTRKQQIDQFPGLGNIPILGALFRSRDFASEETELVVLVTPYLVQPSVEAPSLPTDSRDIANDAESIFLGRLESQYGVGNNAGMRGSIRGSVGFVLD